MKMTLKNRIDQSLEVCSNCGLHNCMHRNDIEVVFYASVMIGSKLDSHHNRILMNSNAVPKGWRSKPSLPDCKYNSAFKKACGQVVNYIKSEYNITPGRVCNLLDILVRERPECSIVRKVSAKNEILNSYLRNLNNLRMHCKEMTETEIYDFSFDMMYDFIDQQSLSQATLFLSFIIMYWIQRENKLIPLALACKKDVFLNVLDTISEDTLTKKERKKKFRLFMRKMLDLHLKLFIKNVSQDSVKPTSRERIINLIKNNPKHTAKTLASCLGLSVHAVRKQIVILKEEKRLKRIGPDNGGHWQVIEKKYKNWSSSNPHL